MGAAKAFAATTINFNDEYTIFITATPAELSALTEADYAAFASKGFDFFSSTTGAFTVDVTQAFAIIAGGLKFDTNSVVTLAATADAIEALTASDFEALSNVGVDFIDIGSEAAVLTVAQVDGFDPPLRFKQGSNVTAVDTGSDLGGGFVGNAASRGILHFDATDNVIRTALTNSTSAALELGISFAAEDVVMMAIDDASIDAKASIFALMAEAGVDIIGSMTGNATVSVATVRAAIAAGLTFSDDEQFPLVDTASAIEALTTDDIAAFAQAGVDRFEASDRPPVLDVAQALAAISGGISIDAEVVRDEGSAISALTVAQILAFGAIGITTLDASGGSYGLTKAQADALAAAGIGVSASDIVTLRFTVAELVAMTSGDVSAYLGRGFDKVVLADTAAAIAALTATQIADLDAKGVDFIDATDAAVAIDAAQALAIASAGLYFDGSDVVTLRDTGANLAALTPGQIGGIGAIAGLSILDSSTGSLTLDYAQVDALIASGLVLSSADTVTLADTSAALGALTTTQIAALAHARGIDAIRATDNALTLSLAQFNAFVATGILFLGNLTVGDTGAVLNALTVAQIANLDGKGVRTIDATDNALTLTLAQFNALNEITLTPADMVTLADTGANLRALSTAQIANLGASGIDRIDATENALTLSLAQFNAFGTAGITLAPADAVTLADTGANLKTLTTVQIANLRAKGVDTVDATDNTLTLSLAQFNAYGSAGITLNAADVVTLADTGANLKTLTTAQIANLDAKGVDRIDATDNTLALSIAQFNAYGSAGITLTAADVVTLTDTGANLKALTTAQIANLRAKGVDGIDATDNALTLSLAQFNTYGSAGITLAAADTVTLSDTGAALGALTAAQIANLDAKGIDRVDSTTNAALLTVAQAKAFSTAAIGFAAADLVKLIDTGANIATLTTAQIAALKTTGIDSVDSTTNAASLTVAQAKAFSTAGIGFAAADTVKLADSGANIATLTTAQIAALKTTGIDSVDSTTNAASLSVAQAKAFSTAGIGFAAADAVKLVDTGANI
ncbi:beta strand repeat-containing protein, partial [Rhizobiaceae sp. 2RAB30]